MRDNRRLQEATLEQNAMRYGLVDSCACTRNWSSKWWLRLLITLSRVDFDGRVVSTIDICNVQQYHVYLSPLRLVQVGLRSNYIWVFLQPCLHVPASRQPDRAFATFSG